VPYLDLAEFRDLTLCSGAVIDRVEASARGWIARQLAFHSDRFDSRLRKRYACPFASPPPLTVQQWLGAVVTPLVMLKGGMAPQDQLLTSAQDLAAAAEAQLTEAANSETGLFELPLRADLPGAGGVTQGAPHGYTEASPYVWRDVQRATAAAEDSAGTGTVW
jgi:hypothetical protein